MMELREPKYHWGQLVKTSVSLFNDGSYPDAQEQALLVQNGTLGEIVQVGTHLESGVPVYLVEFGPGCVVGCQEEELVVY